MNDDENYNKSVEINHNPNWPYIPNHPYRKLVIVGSGSGKTNVLLNLIKRQHLDIGKIYLYVKDPFGSKYYLFINRREKVGIKQIKNQSHSLIIHKQLMFMKIYPPGKRKS